MAAYRYPAFVDAVIRYIKHSDVSIHVIPMTSLVHIINQSFKFVAPSVAPKKLENIVIKQAKKVPSTSSIRRTAGDYGKRYLGNKPLPTLEEIARLRATMLTGGHELQKKINGANALEPRRFQQPPSFLLRALLVSVL